MNTQRAYRAAHRNKLSVGLLSALLLVGCDETLNPVATTLNPRSMLLKCSSQTTPTRTCRSGPSATAFGLRLGNVNTWTSASFDITDLVDAWPFKLSAAGDDANTLVLGRGDGRRDHSSTV
ncbi:MAG: hypothetical protein ACR2QM_16435 [Longimicrobiales bacterium]